MAYTPINWQIGDTITAEKLNRCDNGWSVGTSELFSETVTTVDEGDGTLAMLEYSGVIDAPTLTVTFDGVDYACSVIEGDSEYYYGGFSEFGPDFTDYPFTIVSDKFGYYNGIFTETEGTYTVAAGSSDIEVSAGFSAAVAKVTGGVLPPMLCVSGVTSADDMTAAINSSRMMYFYFNGGCFIVAALIDNPGQPLGIAFIPEDELVLAKFDNDGIFTVSDSN